jgi:aryl-alcohol dehydrogenase-like predicted oxidoreductase
MQYRTLGRTGIKVSPYALGAMMFGVPNVGNTDHDSAIRIIHKALDAGINFVDTADVYGESEVIVGKALKDRRDGVVLATKFSRPMSEDPNRQGTSRRWIMTAVENSLRRLQTYHIDLSQIHRIDPDTDIEEALSAMPDLIHSCHHHGAGVRPVTGAKVGAGYVRPNRIDLRVISEAQVVRRRRCERRGRTSEARRRRGHRHRSRPRIPGWTEGPSPTG